MTDKKHILERIRFTDLYLGIDTINPPQPDENVPELMEVRQRCEAISRDTKRKEFAIEYDGIMYRVSAFDTLRETVYVIRIPHPVMQLADLGIHRYYLNLLLQPDITGLVVIAGSYGEGKTTTGLCMVKERLKRYGGIAITIEDPPEMRIEGDHGIGYCYQTDVQQGDFGQACRAAARLAPTIIYLGEVRDAETATEALRASINGRLVICTTHSDSATGAVERIYSLANKLDSSDDAASLLSAGLTGVIHQKLETVGDEIKPTIDLLWLDNTDPDTAGIRANVKKRQFPQLASFVQLQRNRMLASCAKK